MRKYFKKNNKAREVLSMSKGFTLVETLVAISIFTVSILGMMSVLASGVSNTSYAKQKMIAGYLAQEGIEYVRNMRDTYALDTSASLDWHNFKIKFNQCNSGNDKCGIKNTAITTDSDFIFKCNSDDECRLYIDNGSYSSVVSSNDSGFVRKVWMRKANGDDCTGNCGGDDEVKIFSRVEWTQGSGAKSVTFSENLFNWVELTP